MEVSAMRARLQTLAGGFLCVLIIWLAPPIPALASPVTAQAMPSVVVDGQVGKPAVYALTQVAAVTQTTLTLTVGRHQLVERGALLEPLVNLGQPAFPPLLTTKIKALRVPE